MVLLSLGAKNSFKIAELSKNTSSLDKNNEEKGKQTEIRYKNILFVLCFGGEN